MSTGDMKNETVYTQERLDQFFHARAKEVGMSRRRFFQLLGAGSGAVALSGLPLPGLMRPAQAAHVTSAVKPVPPELFYALGTNYEMRWEVMANKGYLVPIENFFIRSHTSTPHIDVSTYRLKIFGSGVRREIELSYDDIMSMAMESETKYIECAGNARKLFGVQGGCSPPAGTQWLLGAVGVAEWTGVPLRDILERAGVKRTAVDVMAAGLDAEVGTSGHVRKPMSLEKAFEEDTLVVVAMNGQTLPEDHGFPVRLLVPGWGGINSIKWVGSIEVSETPLYSLWNTTTYVLENGPGPGCTPGFYPCPPPVVEEQTIKSAFELAWPTNGVPATIPAGRAITGRAWSPHHKIEKVEVSVDGGPYQEAKLSKPNIPQAWARFRIELRLTPGTHTLRSRATDKRGNVQPDTVPCNRQGYLYNAVVRHDITVV